eukprot:Polyplicarium_translucidae@DN2865_c0_g1_i4.p1
MLIRKGKFQELLRQRGGTHLSSQLVDLLSKMLSPDFQTRPTPLQCLAHPWFKNPKCVVDDRTVYNQSRTTADRLGLHPILVKKQQAQNAQIRFQQTRVQSSHKHGASVDASSSFFAHTAGGVGSWSRDSAVVVAV